MRWRPGVPIGDFFYSLLREVRRAKLNLRFACVMMTGKLPREIKNKAKTELVDKEAMNEIEARNFIVKVKEFLCQGGISLCIDFRNFDKVASLKDDTHDDIDSDKSQIVSSVNALRLRPRASQNWRAVRRSSAQLECYERGHVWRLCPKRTCSLCDGKGHDPANCLNNDQDSTKRDYVKVVSDPATSVESAVTLEVKINGVRLLAMLDTGAKPSVMDKRTLREISGYDAKRAESDHVYGLDNNPIAVLGCVNIEVDLDDQQVSTQEFKIIDTDERILILV